MGKNCPTTVLLDSKDCSCHFNASGIRNFLSRPNAASTCDSIICWMGVQKLGPTNFLFVHSEQFPQMREHQSRERVAKQGHKGNDELNN